MSQYDEDNTIEMKAVEYKRLIRQRTQPLPRIKSVVVDNSPDANEWYRSRSGIKTRWGFVFICIFVGMLFAILVTLVLRLG